LWPANFKAVFSNVKSSTGGTKILVVGNKTLAGIAYLLSLVAIKLGNVTVVNSLAGFEFVFILLLAFIFTYKFPKYFQEAVHNKNDRLKKIWASGLIIIGFVIMFL
jgi:hypothetical protein